MAKFSFVSFNNIEGILKKKDTIIFAAIVMAGFLFAKNIYTIQQKKAADVENETETERQKIELAKEVVALRNKITQLGSAYRRSDSALSLEKLNELASAAKVTIALVTPGAERELDYSLSLPFQLELTANYNNLIKFISALEAQPGMVKVEGISIHRAEESPQETGKSDAKTILGVSMSVSETFIKGE